MQPVSRSVTRDVLTTIVTSGAIALLVLACWVVWEHWRLDKFTGVSASAAVSAVFTELRAGIIAIAVCCAVAALGVLGSVRRFQNALTRFEDTLQRLPNEAKRKSQAEKGVRMREPNYREAEQLARAVDDIHRAFTERETRFERSKLRLRDQLNQRTQEAAEASTRAYHLAMVDPLTKLPNRMMLNEELEKVLTDALARRLHTAVLFVDVDHFKRLNDTLGHERGDRVLQHVAQTLRIHLREADIAARLGGDEFVVVIRNLPPESAKTIVDRYLGHVYAALRNPIELAERSTLITLSIGAAMYPADGRDGAGLLRAADSAMYLAKQKGRNRADWYKSGLSNDAAASSKLEQSLRQGIADKQLVVMFQPQVRADDGMPVGVEALVRWNHPQKGLIQPAAFIKVAEQSGLIVPLGQSVLEMTLSHARRWNARDLNMRIAVNLSIRQLEQQGWIESLQQMVDLYDVPPNLVDLEITESVIADDPIAMEKMLKNLAARGFTLSLDDFGTGYSSLNYLARFPFDNVKIDRQFVQDIDGVASRNVVQSIIALGHALNMRTIAEGVETPQQFRILREMGCDEVQGFFVSEPMKPDEISGWWDERVETTRFLAKEELVAQSGAQLAKVRPISSGRSMSATQP